MLIVPVLALEGADPSLDVIAAVPPGRCSMQGARGAGFLGSSRRFDPIQTTHMGGLDGWRGYRGCGRAGAGGCSGGRPPIWCMGSWRGGRAAASWCLAGRWRACDGACRLALARGAPGSPYRRILLQEVTTHEVKQSRPTVGLILAPGRLALKVGLAGLTGANRETSAIPARVAAGGISSSSRGLISVSQTLVQDYIPQCATHGRKKPNWPSLALWMDCCIGGGGPPLQGGVRFGTNKEACGPGMC